MQDDTSRALYLVVYSRQLFKAHWALFVPQINNTKDTNIGRQIHATGDARNGFAITYDRNYNIDTTTRPHSLTLLGYIGSEYIDDVSASGNGTRSTDFTPLDRLESLAASVPAPGPSLRSSSSSGPRKRVEVKDCQTWLRDFITLLVEDGVLHADAIAVLDNAPKH